jgi:hypothetical protein
MSKRDLRRIEVLSEAPGTMQSSWSRPSAPTLGRHWRPRCCWTSMSFDWSDGRRSYVLLFNGTDQELHVYMTKMGIIA